MNSITVTNVKETIMKVDMAMLVPLFRKYHGGKKKKCHLPVRALDQPQRSYKPHCIRAHGFLSEIVLLGKRFRVQLKDATC